MALLTKEEIAGQSSKSGPFHRVLDNIKEKARRAAEMNPLKRKKKAGGISRAPEEAIRKTLEHTDKKEKKKKEHAIDIPAGSSDHPLKYLFEIKDDYLNLGAPLYEASATGDWETAKSIFDKRKDLVRIGLSNNLGTALHVVATMKENKKTVQFAKNLVNMMTKEDLEQKNIHGNTAFLIACAVGNIKMARMMMEKNDSLLNIRGYDVVLPLCFGALCGTHKIVKWLYDHSQNMTSPHMTDEERVYILNICINRGFFDIALQILEAHQELAGNNMSQLLLALARNPCVTDRSEKKLITRITKPICRFFGMKEEDNSNALKLLKNIWGHATRTMNLDDIFSILKGPSNFLERKTEGMFGQLVASIVLGVQDKLPRGIPRALRTIFQGNPYSGILFVAAETGNTMFIVQVLRSYPDVMLFRNKEGLTIFHIAVMRRHIDIYNLLYEIGNSSHICQSNDTSDNNMLHLVGKTSKEMASKATGASLPMQRELLWFKEVEKMMPPYLRGKKNKDGKTPYELFYEENKDLVSKEMNWMKECMVIATLIVTVAFAAAFTVPGDYKQDKGLPFFLHQRAFLVFIIADAISLFSSSTSLLLFLSILTCRHEQHDFYIFLPTKLTTGLVTLIISVGAMMVTFSASFFVLYHNGLKWIPILVAAFLAVPVIVFSVSQSPLLVDMFRSMYDSHYLFNPKKRMLYMTQPPRSRSNNSSCWWLRYKTIIKWTILKKE